MLVDKATAKQHLRLTVADGSPQDAELEHKLRAAEDIIIDYVSRNEPGATAAATWTTPDATPPRAQEAVLMMVAEFWRFHGDDVGAAIYSAGRNANEDLPPVVMGLLRRFTDPVLA